MRTPPYTNSVPRLLEPRKLAAQGKTIAGSIAPGDCSRLLEVVEAIREPLAVELRFYKDEQNRVRLVGTAEALVSRTCQRCLMALDLRLAADIDLAVVFSEEEMRILPREMDTWYLLEETGDIISLVEEELLVSLPIVSCHALGSCNFPAGFGASDEGTQTKDNPFNVLGQLKGRASETN